MLTISQPLCAEQAQRYHDEQFANAKEAYYSQGEQILGEWQGTLAEQYGLQGAVQKTHFSRLSEGQHPDTREQLVRHLAPRSYQNDQGKSVRSMEHRSGWDLTIAAPKSVSITALVGGDARVREAHRESVRIALNETERYVQARVSGVAPPETTGAWIVAKFEHDTSRSVENFVSPHLHTHCFVMNMTETADGKTRSLQPQELYRTQQFATAVYRSELATHLQGLGYQIEIGAHWQPEIKGYSEEYLQASSPRSREIRADLEEKGLQGAKAAQISAHQTRSKKVNLPKEVVLEQHLRMAAEHGNQHIAVLKIAEERAISGHFQARQKVPAEQAVDYALNRSMERTAVADERALLRDALRCGIGAIQLPEIRAELEKRIEQGELIEVQRKQAAPGRFFTTSEMQSYEREIIASMQTGQDRCEVLVNPESRHRAELLHPALNPSQKEAVAQVLSSQDRIQGLEGLAGTGKTTSLTVIREAAAIDGYQVKGLAPTSRAAQKLAEAGMKTETLQMHLSRENVRDSGQKQLYIVDESSMASTRQMRDFLGQLKEYDRVLLVGDTRQHEAVEAGRPYAQLHEAGMRTARLQEIVRQKDPELKQVVEKLARGEVHEAVMDLQRQGRVHEVTERKERIAAITDAYVQRPEKALVISPDNRSRGELNLSIHQALQGAGQVKAETHTVSVLQPRQDMTSIDRRNATCYERENMLRFTKSSNVYGVKAGEYAQVTQVDREKNLITVMRKNSEELQYDPRKLHGVTVYRKEEREFAVGDRVQLTAPYHSQSLANREIGTIAQLNGQGEICLKMDSGRDVRFNTTQYAHLDYGYAVTSHSSQGETAGKVYIHIDNKQAAGQLLNSRMAYVSVSRAQHDVQIFTNDAGSLGHDLSRDVTHSVALPELEFRVSLTEGKSVKNTAHSMEMGK